MKLKPVLILTALLGTLTIGCGWFGEAQDVAMEQAGPRALLKKYEWFKDAAAACDKGQADIKLYEARIRNLQETYQGQPRSKWPREDREQYNLWQSEMVGVKASYNGLAASYNSAMAKANWDFCNAGKLPPGAVTPLPREFKPYMEQ